MRYNEILSEYQAVSLNLENDELTQKLKDFVNIIKKECNQWLEESHKEPCYRGMYNLSPSIMYNIKPVENRKPLNSTSDFHRNWNKLFKELDFTVNRSNCIFATGSRGVASDYGYLYIIYPKNGYEYIWSPKVRDSWKEFNFNELAIDRDEKVIKRIKASLRKKMLEDPHYIEAIKQWYDGDMTSDSPPKITFDQYLHDYVEKNVEEQYEELVYQGKDKKINYKPFYEKYKDYYKNNVDLYQGLKSRNEIMIKCEAYHAIPDKFYDMYKDML